jgi:hypothetical protein
MPNPAAASASVILHVDHRRSHGTKECAPNRGLALPAFTHGPKTRDPAKRPVECAPGSQLTAGGSDSAPHACHRTVCEAKGQQQLASVTHFG